MSKTNQALTRRRAIALAALSSTAFLNLGRVHGQESAKADGKDSSKPLPKTNEHDSGNRDDMQLHFLEIVTKDVDAVCALYSQTHGVAFGEALKEFGGARTVQLAHDCTLSVRAPMHDGERPVVRPYMRVDDIEAAVAEAKKAGAEVMVPPMKVPEHGMCAIVYQGEIEIGLWQA